MVNLEFDPVLPIYRNCFMLNAVKKIKQPLKPRYLLKPRRLFPDGYDETLYYMVFEWADGVPVYKGMLLDDGQFVPSYFSFKFDGV